MTKLKIFPDRSPAFSESLFRVTLANRATMWISLAVVAFCLMMTTEDAHTMDKPLENLERLRWEYRLVLVYATGKAADNALSNLEEYAPGIEDRDIAWFLLTDDALSTNYRGALADSLRENLLNSWFKPIPEGSTVLLIGKDGFLKSRSADLDLETTFQTIDSMPMRRQEMQRQ